MPLALERFGDTALRVRLPHGADSRAVLDALKSLEGVVDAVVCERHAMVTFDPGARPDQVEATVDRALGQKKPLAAARRHIICVRYDGEDLLAVATMSGLSVEQVVTMHVAGDYSVTTIGFLPGFAYLRGLDARLWVPRRPSPRVRVAPLAVGLGGPYTGVYPFASPGGWSLIGTAVGFAPFDARSGAALELGDRVRFARAPP